ncbi:MAG: fructose-bisphosphate aldolase class I, partial [Candidatus Omnitrophica bacterium]|nr:fructose-bisphosphate aldolase class I [Candidatus Omnitrophota bacterium]
LRMLQAAKGLIEARQVSSPQAVPTERISESQAFGEYIAKLEDRIRVVRANPKDGGEDARAFAARIPSMNVDALINYVISTSDGYLKTDLIIKTLLLTKSKEGLRKLAEFINKLYSKLEEFVRPIGWTGSSGPADAKLNVETLDALIQENGLGESAAQASEKLSVQASAAETSESVATPAPAAEPDQAAAGTVITVGGETLKLRETSERKLFPRGVRKELNRLRETIFGVMEKEGASFNDIKAALAAQDFKFLDAATFTDISSLTEDKLHEYYSGSFEDALDLMGRIQYMVALRYRAGISRRLHTAIVVLASGRAAIHMTGNPNFMLCKAIEDASIPAAQRLIAQQTHSAETVAAAEEILSAQRISSMTADGLAAYVMKAEKGSTYVPDILRLFTPTSSTLTGFIASLSKKLVLAKPADIGLTIRSLASALRKLAEVPGSVSAQLDPSISPGEWTIETKQMLFKRYTSLFEGQSGIKDELRNIIDLISRPGGLRPSVNKLNMDIHNGVYGVASHILPSIYYMGAGDKEYYPLLVRDDFGNMIPLAIEKISAQDGEEKIKEEYSTYIISEMPDDDIRFMIGNSSAGEPAFVTDLWLDYLDLRYLAAYCGTTEAGPAATPAPAQNDTVRAHLRDIAARIVPANGGILAADESTGTAGKRLESVGLPNTPENRQTMRQLILTVPGQEKAGVSAVILYGETFDNVSKNDENLVQEHLVKRGILPGIKTDAGLIDDPDSPGEKLPDPKGLQKLPELLAKYKAKGAVFTKWRVTLSIDTVKGLPTDANIRKNAVVLANSAKQTQEAGLVPIIEPEVLLDGSHDIAASYKATTRTLEIVFEELAKAGVWLDGAVLKTSMILSGNKAVNRADANTVGYHTLKGLLKTVPQEVPAIVFLSGGQEDDEANNNLNAVTVTSQTKFETVRDEAAAELKTEGKTEAAVKLSQLTQVPWQLSYSFGRGLQRPGLKAWAGKSENFEKAQGALLEAARTTQKARLGLLRAWPRPSEVPEDKRVVVLISGGESAGVNNYFAQLAVGLAEQGYSLEVVRFGLDGLVQPREEFAKNLVWIDEKRSYSIINMPGAVEGTARVSLSDEKHPEYMLNAIANLKGYCKTVIMVGGSDHMAEATKISNELRAQGTNDMVVMALPKSIDYDAHNVYMVGADTAGSYANKFVIRAAPMPGESKVVVSEIMGRDSGYLTIRAADMNTADRSGYAEAELRKMKAVAPTVIALTPEWSVDEKGASVVSLTDVVNAVKRRMDKYGAATVVVSEGFRISPDDELLRRILENPFFKDKFTNVKKDKQGNLLFNEIGIGNFVTEALSIALGEELRLEREKNLLYELPGYSFRCVQPGEIDMAVVDSITAKAVDMIINRRDEIIQRGGVCIATRRGIKSASDTTT